MKALIIWAFMAGLVNGLLMAIQDFVSEQERRPT